MTTNHENIQELLNHIDPAVLTYQEWLAVGMALEEAGHSVDVWDSWSASDAGRYERGTCARKWKTFRGHSSPVTIGTIVQMAKDQGWTPQHDSRALDWDAEISYDTPGVVIDRNWIETREVTEPAVWQPEKQLIKYLETLFESSDFVGYVTHSFEKDGKYLPDKGSFKRTAGELIEGLSKCGGDLGAVLGDYKPEVGAWIRFNPLDGNGVRNDNVADFRYALVESDSTDVEKQNALIRELELPVACLVHSGKKSLHAIVRIDAADYSEYRKRVDYLYDVCKRNGLEVDAQNRNPSRLSRMPGVMRSGKKQYLIDTNIGKKSWDEWHEWIESVNDDLPDPENIADVWDCMPELSPPLIDGMLRQGHKMLLAGPSKAGKSFALIELCIAIAEGTRWLGWQCARGKVMYVNLELNRASCLRRFKDVYEASGIAARNLANLDIWNLRGKAVPMDKLTPRLIRRALKKKYIAIVIDPIYKVITGDENNADQMAKFCNQFDKVCHELGAAVIYCHHHSKGSQGQKRSMDRASGSGVFARDPDALLDLIELETTEALLKQEQNKAACEACARFLSGCLPDWEDSIPQDDALSQAAMLKGCEKLLTGAQFAQLKQSVSAAEKAAQGRTAWRIEGTLREFPKFAPVNLWFDYPIHKTDLSGCLGDLEPNAEKPAWKTAADKRKPKEEKQLDRKKKFEEAVANASYGEPPTLKEVASYLSLSIHTAREHMNEHGGYKVLDGKVREFNSRDKE